MRYRTQIKQRKSDETRESNREDPISNPCDLEAESCKINHLTPCELKVEFRPECPQTMHSTNGRLLRGTKTDRFKSENHQEASYGIPEVF